MWKGAFKSRSAIIQNRVQSDLGLLCLSTFKAFLPIIQLVRLGHPADAIVLLRALMERIALLGYLNENNEAVAKYIAKKNNLQKKAMQWAKQYPLENWMKLYSLLSKVAHSKMEGTAGHILDPNPIGEAFRKDISPSSQDNANLTDELLAFIWYILMTTYPIASAILQDKKLVLLTDETDVLMYLERENLVEFAGFLKRFQEKYDNLRVHN